MTKLTIAIDFDGTIVQNDYPNVGAPYPDAVDAINLFYSFGHIIIINTCRAGIYADEAKRALASYGIPYHYFNENAPERTKLYGSDTRKISADLYIDDKDPSAIFNGIDWRYISYVVGRLTGEAESE